MTEPAPRCEPPEHLRGKDDWHWIGTKFGRAPMPTEWDSFNGRWAAGAGGMPEQSHTTGYRYLGPIPSHADLAALVAAAGDALGQLYLVGIENTALLAALEPFKEPS